MTFRFPRSAVTFVADSQPEDHRHRDRDEARQTAMASNDKFPPPASSLTTNLQEVLRLVGIHEQVSGKGRGRRRNLEVLNKSGIVLLVACWEAFIEDLAAATFAFLMENAAEPSAFPKSVLIQSTKVLRSDNDESKVWALAGNGWRQVLETHRNSVTAQYIGKLNTPKPKQIDELFEKLLGLRSISAAWRWKGVHAKTAAARLEKLVVLRGEIAHRVSAGRPVLKRDVSVGVDLVEHLAVCSSNKSRGWLKQRTGKAPWSEVHFEPTLDAAKAGPTPEVDLSFFDS